MDVEDARTDAGRASKNAYATAEDFCAIFTRDTDSLFSLALLLTGDPRIAEKCFFAALSECAKASGVFKRWTRSWARIALIKSAVRISKPKFRESDRPCQLQTVTSGLHPVAAPIFRLSAFDRFVFVLAVLDFYSLRDCAVLLRSTLQEVETAKQRALKSIGEASAHVFAPPPSSFAHRLAI